MWRKKIRHLAMIVNAFPILLRERGFSRALQISVSEVCFDLWNHSETSVEVPRGFDPARNLHSAHEGSTPALFAELFRHVPLDRSKSVFLDLGAGKGRALLLAARHGFGRVIGVELNPEYSAVAERNIAEYRKRDPQARIELHCADAAEFVVPAEVDVAYFYNPFGAGVMRAVVDRICESLVRTPREFYVVKLLPHYEHLFVDAGFSPVFRLGAEGLVLHRARPA